MRLTLHDVNSAPEQSKPRLETVQKMLGFTPNLVAVLAGSPQALAFYQEVSKLNAQSSLTPIEIEVVQLVTATLNGCEFCIAGHTRIAKMCAKMPSDILEAVIKQQPLADAKLQALVDFTTQVVNKKAQVSDADLSKVKEAGFSEQNILDIVLGVGLATFSNYVNNVAQTEINPELQAYRP